MVVVEFEVGFEFVVVPPPEPDESHELETDDAHEPAGVSPCWSPEFVPDWLPEHRWISGEARNSWIPACFNAVFSASVACP